MKILVKTCIISYFPIFQRYCHIMEIIISVDSFHPMFISFFLSVLINWMKVQEMVDAYTCHACMRAE